MQKSKMIWKILKRTGADKLLCGYISIFTAISIVLVLIEPNIHSFGDSVWFCFSVMTTIGFGDLTAVTTIGRILVIFLSIYSILIIAIIPGILTSYYIESTRLRANESVEKFLYDLERLPELSKKELTELSEKVKRFHKNKQK
jgi:voltage-gated potassium channel